MVVTLGFHTYLAYVVSQSKGETGDNSGKSQDLPAEISGGTLILTKHNVPKSNVLGNVIRLKMHLPATPASLFGLCECMSSVNWVSDVVA